MKESIEDFPMEVPTVPVSTASEGPSGSTSSCNSALLHPGGIVNTSCISTENMVGMDFDIAEYHSEAMNVMHDLFLSGALTDVTLIVEANQIRCHRIVLVGASPYFRAMFCTNMRESEMAQIELHCISTTALRKLVEFAYTGKIRIDEHNVCELLTASSMVQMNHVIEACCTFLEHQLHASNVIGICEFATSNSCTGLALAAQTFLDQNFNEVVKYDEFLALTPTQLFSMIKRDNLSVRTEAEVYNAMIRWINHDRSSRLSLLLDALYVVRCHTLSPNFIRSQIKNCSLLAGVPSAKMHLQSVLRDLVEHRHVLMKRRTAGSSEILYSAGGYLRYSLSAFECYNPHTNKWRQLPDIPSPRSGLSACSVRGCVYLVGGRNNNEQGNIDAPHMDCYDPIANSWHTCAPMSVPRNRVAVGVIDDMIYAIGGSTNTLPHNSCEVYDADLGRWTPIACMRYRRIGLGVAVLNRLLYAVGGFDGERRLSTVERYDPETDSWEELASLNRARSGAGVVTVGQYIYAVGGYDSCSQLRTVERYDPERNVWEYRASMLHPRSALSAAVLDNEIWVFGGYDGNEFLSSIEVYNPTTNQWTERAFMDCGKSGHAIVVSREPHLKT
ncbi:Kelch ECH-associated protein 1 [Fasciolopsis buskii]|uniref:Kelch ECH-associated protein 1 n=1 Tax=Fasciolopsis buskii TaxID=27845 RepID=A0A8E0RZC3_9TREM|nr:Kelch ECH-associated protein 1 [Fasciolopsis buski]